MKILAPSPATPRSGPVPRGFHHRVASLLLALTTLSFATPPADDCKSNRPPRQEDRKPTPEHYFNRWDTNKDGKITFEEFARIDRIAKLPENIQKKLFDRFDRNNDGVIVPGEMTKGNRDKRRDHKHFFRNLDKNNDGRISFEEFFNSERLKDASPERIRAFFNRLDRNGDGFIDHLDRPKNRDRRQRNPRSDSPQNEPADKPSPRSQPLSD